MTENAGNTQPDIFFVCMSPGPAVKERYSNLLFQLSFISRKSALIEESPLPKTNLLSFDPAVSHPALSLASDTGKDYRDRKYWDACRFIAYRV